MMITEKHRNQEEKHLNFFSNVIQIIIIKKVTIKIKYSQKHWKGVSSHFSFHLIITASDFHNGLKRLMLCESCVNILFICSSNIFMEWAKKLLKPLHIKYM